MAGEVRVQGMRPTSFTEKFVFSVQWLLLPTSATIVFEFSDHCPVLCGLDLLEKNRCVLNLVQILVLLIVNNLERFPLICLTPILC